MEINVKVHAAAAREIRIASATMESAVLSFEDRVTVMVDDSSSPMFETQWSVASPLALMPKARTGHGGHLTLNRSPHGNKTNREQFVPVVERPYRIVIEFQSYRPDGVDVAQILSYPTVIGCQLIYSR